MARFPTRFFATTDASNESISASNAIVFKEQQLPGTVNNSARALMSAMRLQYENAQWFDYGDDPTRTAATKFTLAGDQSSRYHAGRRIWCMDGGNDLYGEIVSASYSSTTEITVALDSGSLTASLSAVALAIITNTSPSLPGRANQPGRNLLHNGEFDVCQAGTTVTGLGGSTARAIDRWHILSAGTPQGRVSAIQQTGFGGAKYSLRLDCTTAEGAVAAGEVIALVQPLEAQDLQHLRYGTSSAKPLTVSFRVKSPKSGTHCVALFGPDGTRSYVAEFSVTAADTEEYKSVTFPGDASGTINNDTGEGLRLVFPLVCGSNFQTTAGAWAAGTFYATASQQNLLDSTNNNFDITLVKLDVGTVATPFDHKEYGETIRQCRRHFRRFKGAADNSDIGMMHTVSTTRAVTEFNLGQPMRATPTGSLVGTVPGMPDLTGGTISSINATLASGVDANVVNVHWVTSSTTAFESSRLRLATAATDFIDFSAELL